MSQVKTKSQNFSRLHYVRIPSDTRYQCFILNGISAKFQQTRKQNSSLSNIQKRHETLHCGDGTKFEAITVKINFNTVGIRSIVMYMMHKIDP
jgi:hypothetical protein